MGNFIHNHIDIPELMTQEFDNKRYYITPSGKKYPSITTLLGQTSKEGIQEWRDSVGEIAADQISSYACNLGTLFHEHIERYIQNDKNFLSNSTVHSKYMFYALEPYLNNINNIIAQEATLYSDTIKLAGRTDCIGEYEGKLSVIDFKTSRKDKKEEWIQNYFVQGTAYSLMIEEMTGIKIQDIVILMSTYDSKPLIFKTKRSNHFKQLADIMKQYLPSLEYKNEI